MLSANYQVYRIQADTETDKPVLSSLETLMPVTLTSFNVYGDNKKEAWTHFLFQYSLGTKINVYTEVNHTWLRNI